MFEFQFVFLGMMISPVKSTTATLSGVKVNQPLNPAALVVPPTPPPQFPHQVLIFSTIFWVEIS